MSPCGGTWQTPSILSAAHCCMKGGLIAIAGYQDSLTAIISATTPKMIAARAICNCSASICSLLCDTSDARRSVRPLQDLPVNSGARRVFHAHGVSNRICCLRDIWESPEIREIVELVRAGELRVVTTEIDGEGVPCRRRVQERIGKTQRDPSHGAFDVRAHPRIDPR